VAADAITLHGRTVDPAASYRVTVNAFLADGGDGFAVFRDGAEPRTGPSEVAALEVYFKANSPLSPRPLDRIRRAY
jgi:5'-nucleotidase